MHTLVPSAARPPGQPPRSSLPPPAGPPHGTMSRAGLWLDCRHRAPGAAAGTHDGEAHAVEDVLPPAGRPARPEYLSRGGVAITGPVHGPAAGRRLLRGLLAAHSATEVARRYVVEYPAPVVAALVNSALDRSGGWEARAMRARAGGAGAHLRCAASWPRRSGRGPSTADWPLPVCWCPPGRWPAPTGAPSTRGSACSPGRPSHWPPGRCGASRTTTAPRGRPPSTWRRPAASSA